jgi:adenylate cyclase
MTRRHLRRASIILILGLVAGVASLLPALRFLERAGLDLLLLVDRPFALVQRPLPVRPPVAVVAIREETYERAPFRDRPKVAWTVAFGAILDAVAAGDAVAIGLDIVYPTTLDRPDLLPGYDRSFRAALLRAGRSGLLVAGFVQSSERALKPDRAQVAALGGDANLRPLNLLRDPDDVVRAYPPSFATEGGGTVASLAAELVRRAGFPRPTGTVLIDFTIPPAAVPLYEFADLAACAEAGNGAFFREAFDGRIVIFGSVLDVEDRHVTARRFLEDASDREPTTRCVPWSGGPPRQLGRATMPGTLVHAIAALTLALDRAPALLPPAGTAVAVGGFATALATGFFLVSPVFGLLLLAAATMGLLAAALAALGQGIVLPVLPAALAALAAFAFVYAFRFVVEGRTRRRVVHAFRHYLAPSLVDRLAERPDALRLGGESRIVTIAFMDIAGFTTLSERLSDTPDRLVAIVNGVLALVARAIERNGGYIDKFIGDAVMAVWGAPLADPMAAEHAVDAALESLRDLAAYRAELAESAPDLPPLSLRIGINSGLAVAGNVGAPTRLNYTVLGDAVNLASRLEGANKAYGTHLMIGEATRAALPPGRYLLRRLDRLVVKGKTRPVKVYEVVAWLAPDAAGAAAVIRRFHAAVALYYRRRFDAAAAAFASLPSSDPVAAVYADRARRFAERPPATGWDRSFNLETK